MGPNVDCVFKAHEIEQQRIAADAGQCTALSLSDPDAAVPTSTVDSADISSMPTLAVTRLLLMAYLLNNIDQQ
jgi:hypothetical protein